MMWSTEWSRQRARIYKEVIDEELISAVSTSSLTGICGEILRSEDPRLNFELVATIRQSSFLLRGKRTSALCFDLTQSLMLKSLFLTIAEGKDYLNVADSLKEGIALSLSAKNYEYAQVVRASQIRNVDEHYVHPIESLERFYWLLIDVRKAFSTPLFRELLDCYIVAHELFHYLKANGKANPNVLALADEAFDFALGQVCYENESNFREIATYYGNIALTDEALDEIHRTLRERRLHYTATREHLTEEIACDAFAFSEFAFRGVKLSGKHPAEIYDVLVVWYFYILSLCDLHQAMNRRGALYELNGHPAQKPADIADSNFRKTATAYYTADIRCQLLGAQGRRLEFSPELAKSVQRLQPFKDAFDGLYVMPTTRVLLESLGKGDQIYRAKCENLDSTPLVENGRYGHCFSLKKLFNERVLAESGITPLII